MSEIKTDFTTSEKERILGAMSELSVIFSKQEQLSEQAKDVKDRIKEEIGLAPKDLNKLAKDYHNDTFDDTVKNSEDYQELYESVIRSKTVSSNDGSNGG